MKAVKKDTLKSFQSLAKSCKTCAIAVTMRKKSSLCKENWIKEYNKLLSNKSLETC
jgi:hypothetical protein